MTLRILPSDPAYADVNRVAEWIAMLKNPHLFHDLKDMPELERLVMIKELEDVFEELMH